MPHMTETPRDTWSRWTYHAKHRHLVKLNNGAVASLLAVHRVTRSVRVRLYNRHYNCWIEDIAFVSDQPDTEGNWTSLEPWKVVDLDDAGRCRTIRSSKATPSKSWLDIIPDPNIILARTETP